MYFFINCTYLSIKTKHQIMKGDLLDESLKIHARAKRLNQLENEKLERINRIIKRNQKARENILSRVLSRTENSLNTLRGFKDVVNKDYAVNNFETLTEGFNSSIRGRVLSPRTARRLKLETRVYYSGFERRWFKPEIQRKMRQSNPLRAYDILKKVLLAKCENDNNNMIDRNLSISAFHSEVQNRLQQTKDIKIPTRKLQEK